MDLTQSIVQDFLDYDQNTGIFTWKLRPSNCVKAGDRAGSLDVQGYRRLQVCGVLHAEHRLAWLYVHGRWPTQLLDHINGKRSDNRIINLRECDDALNGQNRRDARKDNKIGLIGVSMRTNRTGTVSFRARIRVNHAMTNIGSFATAEDAHQAYVAAKRVLHPAGML